MPDPIAVLCSDIHLSHTPPVARSAEPDWYAAQARPWNEVKSIRNSPGGLLPIIVAGDLFDVWKSPPQLINWAIDTLPGDIYSIPGQHDLPNHSMDLIRNSAYWTLVQARKINHCTSRCLPWDNLVIHPFAWNMPISECAVDPHGVNLAVVHAYIWKAGHSYPGAPEDRNLASYREPLSSGYDAAVFGDNHKGFTAKAGECNVMNCGTFMRRKIDEIDYKPMVGILHDDGSIKPHYLDCSQDKFIDEAYEAKEVKSGSGFEALLAELRGVGPEGLDYRAAVGNYVESRKGLSSVAKGLLLESIGGS